MSTILKRYQKFFEESRKLARYANNIFPDGITSDGRYAEPFPIYIERAQGAKKWGIDGKEFIDYWGGEWCFITRTQFTRNC